MFQLNIPGLVQKRISLKNLPTLGLITRNIVGSSPMASLERHSFAKVTHLKLISNTFLLFARHFAKVPHHHHPLHLLGRKIQPIQAILGVPSHLL